jgi:hypothetical protein
MSYAKTVTRRFFEEADQGRTPVELCGAGFTAHFSGLPVMDLANRPTGPNATRAG